MKSGHAEGWATQEVGRLPSLVQVLPWRALGAIQRGSKYPISVHSFGKESSLEGPGFYGVLLYPFHCALLRRGKKQREVFWIREGPEVSKRHQTCIKLCSAWVLVRWQYCLDELGKGNLCKTFL